MKFSMWMIAEWLRSYDIEMTIEANHCNLDSLRLYTSDEAVNEATVYVGHMKDRDDTAKVDDIVCFHHKDVILIRNTNLSSVLNTLLDGMHQQQKWVDVLTDIVTKPGAALSELLFESREILPYPLFILDQGYYVLAINEGMNIAEDDPNWDELIDNKTPDFERIKALNEAYPDLNKRRKIHQFPIELSNHPCYNRNLFHENHWVGSLSMIDTDGNISNGSLDQLEILAGYVEQWMNINTRSNELKRMDALFKEGITGDQSSLIECQRQLEIGGWHLKDEKILVKLVNTYEDYNLDSHLQKTISEKLSDSYTIVHESSVVILCNLSKRHKETTLQNLKLLLGRSRYCGWVSDTFIDLSELSRHYSQLCVAEEFGDKKVGNIVASSKYMLHYSSLIMKKHITFDAAHADIRRLQQYDRAHNGKYLETLSAYLKNERHQQRTANALNLHRSSLIYRLKKLEEIMDADLDDPVVRLHMLYSIEFLVSVDGWTCAQE